MAELLARQQHLSQASSLPLQQLPFSSNLDDITPSTNYPGIGLYSIDSQSAPMPFLHRGNFQPLQQMAPGLPPLDRLANFPLMSSSSSSEPGPLPGLGTPTPSLLPDPPLLRLGSRSFTPDMLPPSSGPTSQETASAADEKSLLSTLQQLSILGLDETGRPGRTHLTLPQMPADVWQGGLQVQAQPWGEAPSLQSSAPPESPAA